MRDSKRIFFDIVHPADVHQYKNVIARLQENGYECFVFARKKDVTIDLLSDYGINYKVLTKAKKGLLFGFFELVYRTLYIGLYCIFFRPAVLVASTGVSVGFVGFVLHIPNIQFADTEAARLQNRIAFPFATAVYTPQSYTKLDSKKQHHYAGYKELAYLHPNYFTPDESIVRSYGIDPSKRYAVVRFVSFAAQHDTKGSGFSTNQKIALVERLAKYGQVVVSAEGEVPKVLRKYLINCHPSDIHHILAHASVLTGESGTMASEAAVLGVPAIFVYPYSLGYLEEQSKKYNLVHVFDSTTSSEDAIDLSVDLFIDPESKKNAQKNRKQLLDDMIDVTDFMFEQIVLYAKN